MNFTFKNHENSSFRFPREEESPATSEPRITSPEKSLDNGNKETANGIANDVLTTTDGVMPLMNKFGKKG